MTKAFFQYWDGKRHGRRMPARADVDPIEMVRWLPGLQLIDVSGSPRQLRYRLVGEVEVQLQGCNNRGRVVDDAFFGHGHDELARNLNFAIDDKRMQFDWAKHTSSIGHVVSPETIFLPLSNDDDHVNMVITFTSMRAQAQS